MGLLNIFKRTKNSDADAEPISNAIEQDSNNSSRHPGAIGGFSGAQANLLRMASMQHGMFSQQQAMIRGVSQADLQQLIRQGVVEEVWMGYYQIIDFGK